MNISNGVFPLIKDDEIIEGLITVEEFKTKYNIESNVSAVLGRIASKEAAKNGWKVVLNKNGNLYHPEKTLLKIATEKGFIPNQKRIPFDIRLSPLSTQKYPSIAFTRPALYYLSQTLTAIKGQKPYMELIQNMYLKIVSRYSELYPVIPKLVPLKWEERNFYYWCDELELMIERLVLEGVLIKKICDNGKAFYLLTEPENSQFIPSIVMKELIRSICRTTSKSCPYYEQYLVYLSKSRLTNLYL